jgi:FtsH-binding integral membrane protein
MDGMDRGERRLGAGREAAAAVDPALRAFMIGVYNRVALGLLVSAAVAYLVSGAPGIRDLLFRAPAPGHAFAGLTGLGALTVLSPLLVLLGLGRRTETSPRRARLLYWSIVVTVGASLGVIVLAYTAISIATAFAASAIGFGALSLWGYCAERDLKPMASFWVAGLAGLVGAIALNLVLASPALAFAASVVGVLVFAGLIACDTQRLKTFHHGNRHDLARVRAGADLGALGLYLDFINLFEFVLALSGARR